MRVQLICDDEETTSGLHRLLAELNGEFEVMGSSTTGPEGLLRVTENRPDIVIIDLHSKNGDSLEIIRSLSQPVPPVRVLVYSTDMRPPAISSALKAGVKGVISSETREKELHEALRAIRSDRVYISAEIARLLDSHETREAPRSSDDRLALLTQRERQVLQRLSDGQSSKEVAHDLGISSKTVDTHRRNLMRKLGANGVADLVKHALRAGLTTLEPSGPALRPTIPQ